MNYKTLIILVLSFFVFSKTAVSQTKVSLNAGLNHSKFNNTQSFGNSTFQTSAGIALFIKNKPSITFTDNFRLSWNFGVILENRRISIEIQEKYNLNSFALSVPIYLSYEFWNINLGLGTYISIPFAEKINDREIKNYPEGSVETQLFNNVDYGVFFSTTYDIPETKISFFFNFKTSFNAIGSGYVKVDDYGTVAEKVEIGFRPDMISYGVGYKL